MPTVTELFGWSGLDYLLSPQQRLFWGYLLIAFLIAQIYLHYNRQPGSVVFDKRLWWHPSARLDYAYFVVSAIIKLAILYPLLINAGSVTRWLLEIYSQVFGYQEKIYIGQYWLLSAYSLSLFLVGDFSRYCLHRCMHRIPLLWAFHKIHHSAEVLTPFTFYRVHPLENLLFGLRYALSAGLVTSLFLYFFGSGLQVLQILGVNIFVFLAHLLGDNLRHSPIALAYPGWLEKVFISPAQHQLHHRVDGNRCNYGGVLAIWDRVFASLALSSSDKGLPFGLAAARGYASITQLLLTPFREIYRSCRIRPGLLLLLIVIGIPGNIAHADTTKLTLGRDLFFDPDLSLGRNQSCSSCHDPNTAFTDLRQNRVAAAASTGSDGISIGKRNTPSAGYSGLTPAFHFDNGSGEYIGGQFLDGRAVNLQAQAGEPILNPLEMAMPDKASVIQRIKQNPRYLKDFRAIFGESVFSDNNQAFLALTEAIAEFEQSDFFAPFDSKYDRYLRGEYELSASEELGMSLFFSNNNSNCSSCHLLKTEGMEGETFSGYEFHNIGVPVNKLLSPNGHAEDTVDHGLLENPAIDDAAQDGKFKVPGLRNVAITPPYMHNGVFRKLSTVLGFYDSYNNPQRLMNPETGQAWEKPEVAATVNLSDLKAKKLSDRKIEALVSFLELLTDKRYEALLERGQ